MRMSATKRLNFDVLPEQEEELLWLRDAIGASTNKDAVLRAIRVLGLLSREARRGARLQIRLPDGSVERLVLPELESPEPDWKWLTSRPHAWRRQKYVKGRRLAAAALWSSMLANQQSVEEAAEDWDLPLEAVREAVAWCEANRALLAAEAAEERQAAERAGLRVGTPDSR
jgi:hypothetical protein